MSLKAFHIVFIIICVALSLYVGMWGIRDYMLERSYSALAVGVLFLLGGAVLVVYGRSAVEKYKHL